ncbi:PulJ/GspJ family protein [Sideroxyarcus sp. TK5]
MMKASVHLRGFTLVEMIVVIVITGIIAGIVAIFIKAPVQGYVDSARRAELTDIADTAFRRIARDLRLALPNSVRRSGTCDGTATCFLEFIPTVGGGRYRSSAGAGVLCGGSADGDALSFAAADTCFEVFGQMPQQVVIGDQIVVYNTGQAGANAYAGNTLATHNRRVVSGVGAQTISITSTAKLPLDSCVTDITGAVVGGCRFQVVQSPVTYVCDAANQKLVRWQGYPIAATQPTTLPAGATEALLANSVSNCDFLYNAISQRSGLVTMRLAISEQGESVSLYNAAHVNNLP